MPSTKTEFLTAAKLNTEIVAVDGFGEVTLQKMSGKARDRLEAFLDSKPRHPNDRNRARDVEGYRPLAIALCLLDGDGKRMFETDKEIEELAAIDADIIDALFLHVDRINKLTPAAVEEAEGNSEGGQNADSG